MGYIGDQLRLHILAADLLLHRLAEALVHLRQLLLEGLKRSQILLRLHVQVPLGHAAGRLQQDAVLFFYPSQISAEDEKQDRRIDDQADNPHKPEYAAEQQDHKIHRQDPQQPPVGPVGEIQSFYAVKEPEGPLFHRPPDGPHISVQEGFFSPVGGPAPVRNLQQGQSPRQPGAEQSAVNQKTEERSQGGPAPAYIIAGHGDGKIHAEKPRQQQQDRNLRRNPRQHPALSSQLFKQGQQDPRRGQQNQQHQIGGGNNIFNIPLVLHGGHRVVADRCLVIAAVAVRVVGIDADFHIPGLVQSGNGYGLLPDPVEKIPLADRTDLIRLQLKIILILHGGEGQASVAVVAQLHKKSGAAGYIFLQIAGGAPRRLSCAYVRNLILHSVGSQQVCHILIPGNKVFVKFFPCTVFLFKPG